MRPLLKMPTSPRTPVHYCKTCGTPYGTWQEAVECSAFPAAWQQAEPLRVGDFLLIDAGFDYCDDDRWASTDWHFYFMVTAITARSLIQKPAPWANNQFLHETILHVATFAIDDEPVRWIPLKSDYTIVKAPPGLFDQAAHLLNVTGERAL